MISENDVWDAVNVTLERLVLERIDNIKRTDFEKSSEKWINLKPLEDPGSITKILSFNPFESSQNAKPEL